MTLSELEGAVTAEGVDLGQDPEDELHHLFEQAPGPILPLIDERWVNLPTLFQDRTLTHRLTETDANHDLIVITASLLPITMLTENPVYQALADGSPVRDISGLRSNELADRGVASDALGEHGALLFELGTFARLGVRAGELVGLRVAANGFELVAVDGAGTGDLVAERIGPLVDAQSDDPLPADGVIWQLCADDETLFREPVLPLDELLATAGFTVQVDYLARSDFDFDDWHLQSRIGHITERYDLNEDEALAVLATVRLCEQTRDLVDTIAAAELDGENTDEFFDELPEQLNDRTADNTAGDTHNTNGGEPTDEAAEERHGRTVQAAVRFLADPAVAAAVLSEIQSDSRIGPAAMGLFAESLEPQVPAEARPALRWLRGNALEQLGEVEEAERCYRDAESLDPKWPLTLYALARSAGDRGDAPGALALLRRAGAPPDDDLVQLLEAFRPKPRPGLGRNQPCWCGSGRKYKVCHLNREQLPLDQRAGWLYQKAGFYLADSGATGLLLDTAQERSRYWDGSDSLFQALNDPVTTDAVLFEGGFFEEFLDMRGVLLPVDELLLGQQWLLAERSVHEVVSVQAGVGMTLRDVRTGDVHEVQERTASRQLRAGELYCARVVPAGETTQIFGGLEPVSVGERDQLVELLDSGPDPDELVAFLSVRFAPPSLRNTEGEPSVMCTATLRTDDPATLAELLDQTYGRRNDTDSGGLTWVELVQTDGLDRIRAHLELSGDQLSVQANSETRFDRVLAELRSLEPAITLVGETREPAGDLRAIQRLAEQHPQQPEKLDPEKDEAVAEALTQLVHTFESNWLDEQIPALGGRTPRECADDPTRRPDLIRLLDSFPEAAGNPGAMSPARLREALGLPPRG